MNLILDLLFPKRCVGCRKFGSYLCPDCFARISFAQNYFCGVCSRPSYNGLTHPGCKTRHSIDGIFPILNYQGLLKKIMYQYKYNPHLSDLTSVLGEFLYEGIIQNEVLMRKIGEKECVIVPVPLHALREKRRGYNQSELLAKSLSKKLGIEVVTDALLRRKNTSPQYMLPKERRKENIKGAFDPGKNIEKISGMTVFILDDITTTGTTLVECAKVLKHNGVRYVYGVALGHEEK